MIFVHFRMKQLIFQANVQQYIEITGRSICMRNFEQFLTVAIEGDISGNFSCKICIADIDICFPAGSGNGEKS